MSFDVSSDVRGVCSVVVGVSRDCDHRTRTTTRLCDSVHHTGRLWRQSVHQLCCCTGRTLPASVALLDAHHRHPRWYAYNATYQYIGLQ